MSEATGSRDPVRTGAGLLGPAAAAPHLPIRGRPAVPEPVPVG